MHTLFLVIFSLFLRVVWAGPCRFSGQRQITFGSWSWEAWSRQILQRNRTVRESEGERILLGLAWASLHHGGLSGHGLVSRWLPSLRSEGRQVFSLRPGKSVMFLPLPCWTSSSTLWSVDTSIPTGNVVESLDAQQILAVSLEQWTILRSGSWDNFLCDLAQDLCLPWISEWGW